MSSLTDLTADDATLIMPGAIRSGTGRSSGPVNLVTKPDSFDEMVLMGRLREAIQRLNPAIPEQALATIRQFRSIHISSRRATNP